MSRPWPGCPGGSCLCRTHPSPCFEHLFQLPGGCLLPLIKAITMRKGSKKLFEDILNQELFFMLPFEISRSLPRHKAFPFSSLSPVPPVLGGYWYRQSQALGSRGSRSSEYSALPTNTLVKSSRVVGRGTHYPAVSVQAPSTICGCHSVGACPPSHAAVPWWCLVLQTPAITHR